MVIVELHDNISFLTWINKSDDDNNEQHDIKPDQRAASLDFPEVFKSCTMLFIHFFHRLSSGDAAVSRNNNIKYKLRALWGPWRHHESRVWTDSLFTFCLFCQKTFLWFFFFFFLVWMKAGLLESVPSHADRSIVVAVSDVTTTTTETSPKLLHLD